MREGTAVFELQDIANRYGSVVALDGVDLHIDSAATTALIGPSGAANSTLLRMLIGLDWPDRGEVRFDGEPLRRAPPLDQRRHIDLGRPACREIEVAYVNVSVVPCS